MEGKCWHDAGLDQVGALAHAVWHSGLKLDILTLAGISHAIFLTRTERGKSLSRAMRVLIRPLRRLRLYIQAWAPADEKLGVSDESSDSDAEVIESVRTDTSSIFEEGNFRKILNVAKELRVLKLEFPRRFSFDYGPSYARLDLTLPGLFFPHLYDLELSQYCTDGNFLADLLPRHKTLRRLTLGDMQYTGIESQWKTVLTKIGGQLPGILLVNLYDIYSALTLRVRGLTQCFARDISIYVLRDCMAKKPEFVLIVDHRQVELCLRPRLHDEIIIAVSMAHGSSETSCHDKC
jgi:hypothetical protein